MEIEELRARRRERQSQVRRRRVVGALVAGLALAAIALVAVVASSGGSKASAPRVTAAGHGRGAGATTGGANPRERATGRRGNEAVPILMYHVIAPPPAGAPFPGLYVPPQEFAAQMQALKQAGWRAVTLDQLTANWHSGVPLGAGKPIVLTFDNGYQSQFTQALPTLQRLGWVADENVQLTGLPPSQGGLGQQQVRALVAAGWELDTQGMSHADLIRLDAAQLHDQIATARTTLQRLYHVPVRWFCYPSGHYDDTVVEAVRAAGYVGSTTVIPGWAHRSDDPFRLHRLRVLGGTSPRALLELIASTRAATPAPPSYGGA